MIYTRSISFFMLYDERLCECLAGGGDRRGAEYYCQEPNSVLDANEESIRSQAVRSLKVMTVFTLNPVCMHVVTLTLWLACSDVGA